MAHRCQRQSAAAQARPPGQHEGHVHEVLEEQVLPLLTACLDVLAQRPFTRGREEGKTAHVAQIEIQGRRGAVVSRRSAWSMGL